MTPYPSSHVTIHTRAVAAAISARAFGDTGMRSRAKRWSTSRTLTSVISACALLLVLAGVTAGGAHGPASSGIRKQIGTPTRHVVIFTELETQLLDAATHKDRAKLDELLADDFQLWTAEHAADPVDREQWIEMALASRDRAGLVRDVSVNVGSEMAIVSFVLALKPGTSAKDMFLVDVWTRRADTWQLSARYACSIPQQGPPRPTGKE